MARKLVSPGAPRRLTAILFASSAEILAAGTLLLTKPRVSEYVWRLPVFRPNWILTVFPKSRTG